jgi:hypothetical protein
MQASCAQKLTDAAGQISGLRAFVGLDGFVDEIIHVVDKRANAETFQRLETMTGFAQRLAAAAGKSTNIELVNQRTKLGGNGPIMANALAHLGLTTTYLGNVGYPNLHPVFAELAQRAEVFSIAEPCHTDALEFLDGKVMLGKSIQLREINWPNIQARFGREPFCRKFAESDLVAFVNWTMIPYMSDIWEALLHELCPAFTGPRRLIFFDLADPEKRPADDIRRALDLILRFQRHFHVVLGLNEKEAFEIGEVLGIKVRGRSPEAVSELAIAIHCRIPIHTLAIHPVTYALAVSDGVVDLVKGPHIPKPLIATGAGDHFNAGFCLGKLLGMKNSECVLLGVTASGYYVRTARSPDVDGMVSMLRDWPARQNGGTDNE